MLRSIVISFTQCCGCLRKCGRTGGWPWWRGQEARGGCNTMLKQRHHACHPQFWFFSYIIFLWLLTGNTVSNGVTVSPRLSSLLTGYLAAAGRTNNLATHHPLMYQNYLFRSVCFFCGSLFSYLATANCSILSVVIFVYQNIKLHQCFTCSYETLQSKKNFFLVV